MRVGTDAFIPISDTSGLANLVAVEVTDNPSGELTDGADR
jgi:hypothetical protein